MVSDLSRKIGGQRQLEQVLCHSLHVDDGVSLLVDNHLGLVAPARLNKLEVRRRSVGILKYNSYFIKVNLIQYSKTLTTSSIILQAILMRRQTA